MGRKHRESRKSIKSRLLRLGLKENEFGELTKRVSKTEARRVLLGRRLAYFARVRECVDLASKRATEDIQAIEDAIAIDNWEKMIIVSDVMLT